jgi:hypothetical protein
LGGGGCKNNVFVVGVHGATAQSFNEPAWCGDVGEWLVPYEHCGDMRLVGPPRLEARGLELGVGDVGRFRTSVGRSMSLPVIFIQDMDRGVAGHDLVWVNPICLIMKTILVGLYIVWRTGYARRIDGSGCIIAACSRWPTTRCLF